MSLAELSGSFVTFKTLAAVAGRAGKESIDCVIVAKAVLLMKKYQGIVL